MTKSASDMMKDVVTSTGDYAVLESNIDRFEDTPCLKLVATYKTIAEEYDG